MPSAKKVQELAELSELIRDASGYYFIDFTGVAVNDFNMARRRLREVGARVRVVKNRLALRALGESGSTEQFAEVLKGPTSMVVTREDDAVVPARILKDIIKKLQNLRVKGAYVDQTFYGAEQFDLLASLPTKSDLRAQVVGVLAEPIRGLAFTLEGLLNEFSYVLEQLGERRAGDPSGGQEAVQS